MKKQPEIKINNYPIQIVNAEASNEICVVISGRWEGHPAGDYAVTETDLNEILSNFNAENRDLLFDYDHESLWGSSKAAGWGKSLELRDGKIFAKVEFTPEGKKAVDEKEYRYLSNVLIFNYYDPNNKALGGTYLHSVAFTNTPFQKDLPAITNSLFPNMKDENRGGKMDEILKVLGVKTQDEALAKINSNADILANAQTQAARIPELETKISDLETENKQLKETIVNSEIDMAIAKGELLPKHRETAILLKNTSQEAYENFLKNTEKIPADKLDVKKNKSEIKPADEAEFTEFIPGGEN